MSLNFLAFNAENVFLSTGITHTYRPKVVVETQFNGQNSKFCSKNPRETCNGNDCGQPPSPFPPPPSTRKN